MAEDAVCDRQAVDQSAVAASQVADQVLIAVTAYAAVLARDGAAVDADGRGGVAPDDHIFVSQRELRFVSRSGNRDESGRHVLRCSLTLSFARKAKTSVSQP